MRVNLEPTISRDHPCQYKFLGAIYKYPNRTVCSVLPSHPQRIDRGLVQDCSPRYNQIPLFKILRNLLLPHSSSENGTHRSLP